MRLERGETYKGKERLREKNKSNKAVDLFHEMNLLNLAQSSHSCNVFPSSYFIKNGGGGGKRQGVSKINTFIRTFQDIGGWKKLQP